MVAAGGNRKRHPAEGKHLNRDVRQRSGDRRHRLNGQFRWQANSGGAPLCVVSGARLVVDVDKGPDRVRPAGDRPEAGQIVYLNQNVLHRSQISCLAPLAPLRHQNERTQQNLLSGIAQPFDYNRQIRREERRSLRTHDLPDAHDVDRRFIRDAKVEIPPSFRRPVVEDRAETKLHRIFLQWRQACASSASLPRSGIIAMSCDRLQACWPGLP